MPDLTPKQAAAIAGVAPNTIRLWASSRGLPHRLTAGGHRRYDEETIRRWAALRRGPEPADPSDPRADGWCRAAEALLRAAVAELGAGSQAAEPFSAALMALAPPRRAPLVAARAERSP